MSVTGAGVLSKKVIIIGNVGSGKTTLIKTFIDGHFTAQIQQGIVDCPTKIINVDGKPIQMMIWDNAGGTYTTYIAKFWRDADAAMVVFAANDAAALGTSGVGKWMEEAKTRTRNPDLPFFVVQTKSDLEDSKISLQQALAFCQTHGNVQFVPTSSKLMYGVNEAFEKVGRALLRAPVASSSHPVQPSSTVNLSSEKQPQGARRCCP